MESQAKADLNGDEDKGGNDNHDINNNYNDKIFPQLLSVISFQNHKLKRTMTNSGEKHDNDNNKTQTHTHTKKIIFIKRIKYYVFRMTSSI